MPRQRKPKAEAGRREGQRRERLQASESLAKAEAQVAKGSRDSRAHHRVALATLTIAGFRGFNREQVVRLAIPSGRLGSGLTIIVGPNASGKSTILEALGFLQRTKVPPEFGEGFRNSAARGRVSIAFETIDHRGATLSSDPSVGSDVTWRGNTLELGDGDVFLVPSRRAILEQIYQNSPDDRGRYASALSSATRGQFTQSFGGRLARMNQNRANTDEIIRRVLRSNIDWILEPSGGGSQVRLRFFATTGQHLTASLAEGLAALLFVVDGLYDSEPGQLIAIDEPELSLHPSAQRRLAQVLATYASDRQIVYATHSPYLADWAFVLNGARIARTFGEPDGFRIANLDPELIPALRGLQDNLHFPHALRTDARDVFFLDEPVILVEGQEDVVGYRLLSEQLNVPIEAEFYGWGVGGAGNMELIATVLQSLGFRSVVAVLDADQKPTLQRLREKFRHYEFILNPAGDVRRKEAQGSMAKDGLLDNHWRLRDDRREVAADLLGQIKAAVERSIQPERPST